MTAERDAKIIQIRDYVSSMRKRIATLRAPEAIRGEHALAAAFEEIETAHEELTVADEELRAQASAIDSLRAGFSDELRHFRRLFEEAPDGYVVTDLHGFILEANRTLSEALHVHQRFVERKPLVGFVVRADCSAVRGALTRLATGSSVSLVVGLRPRSSQPAFVAEMRAMPVRGGTGHISAIHWAVRMPAPLEHDVRKTGHSETATKIDSALVRLNAAAMSKGLRLVVTRDQDLKLDAMGSAAVAAVLEALALRELAGRNAQSSAELTVVIERAGNAIAVSAESTRVLLPLLGPYEVVP